MYLVQEHLTMTVVPRLGIEPGTPGFEILDANDSTTADSHGKRRNCVNKITLSHNVHELKSTSFLKYMYKKQTTYEP